LAKATPGHLGPYRLLNVVNTGQTSQIWQAYDDRAKEVVGIKILLSEYRRSREHLAYLKQEWVVGGNIKNKRLIQVHDYQNDRGTTFLVMEWFPSQNLKFRLRHDYDKIEPLLPQIIAQMCEGLIALHQEGWVHRDVKPDNFLLSADNEVKLIDFALAKKGKGGLAKMFSKKSKVQGTRSYMSPEQIRGGGLDGRADLYSLGCTIFELFAQKLPFTGVSANELLTKHLRAAPPFLEVSNRNVTSEFGALIRRTMAKKPASRPDSIADFYTEMKRIRIFCKMPTFTAREGAAE
jgi:eukaryotic-like serine/threonine-protein kinase